MDIDLIFKIAGVGLLIAAIHTVLKQAGKEDYAFWAVVVGFIVVIFWVVGLINDLFTEIKTVFKLF
ncbi:MAG: stage III sporulation protein AC [Peptococcaceae bacterium]|nr:stage III sporulation protein AC [Peptococcaceae bacterium]